MYVLPVKYIHTSFPCRQLFSGGQSIKPISPKENNTYIVSGFHTGTMAIEEQYTLKDESRGGRIQAQDGILPRNRLQMLKEEGKEVPLQQASTVTRGCGWWAMVKI